MMDDARQIENLLYTYANLIDAGDFDGIGELFQHGRILASPDAPEDSAAVGRDAVRKMYEMSTRLYEDGTPKTRHVTTNVLVEVDDAGQTATARATATVFQRTEQLPLQPIIVCNYRDSFQKREGRWWFDTRIMDVSLIGDLSQHLLFELK